jgi:hypothetical protein
MNFEKEILFNRAAFLFVDYSAAMVILEIWSLSPPYDSATQELNQILNQIKWEAKRPVISSEVGPSAISEASF